MKKKIIVGLITVLMPSLASAELMQFSFTDATAKSKVIDPKSLVSYLNATSPISYILSGGLDRKLQVEVKTANGLLIETLTSSIINIRDRITLSDGKEFYGKKLTSNKRLSDGNYSITAKILSMDGKVVQSNSFNIVVDTVGPTIAGDFEHKVLAQAGGNINIFDYLEQREISISGISDSNSGLDRASFTARLEGTNTTNETPVLLDPDSGLASWLRPSPGVYRKLFYKNRATYDIAFKVVDKAGNVTEKHRTSDFNGLCGEKKIHSIFNPKTNKWDLYTPGMTIFSNPYKFRVSVPLAENINTSGSKFGYTFAVADSDDQYAYFQAEAAIPRTYTYWEFTTTSGNCGSIHQDWINVKLASDVHQAPAYKGMKMHIVEDNSWHSGDHITRNKPYTVDQFEILVEPRPYVQTAELGSTGSCDVPIDGSSCFIKGTEHAHIEGRGYIPYPLYIGSKDRKFWNHYSYSYEFWDLNAPVFQDIKQDNVHAEMVVYDADAVQDWRRSWWLPSEKYIYAYDLELKRKVSLKENAHNEPTYQHWWMSFDLTSLPEGRYRLDAFTKDVYGNSRTEVVNNEFVVDRTKPVIKLTAKDNPLDGQLHGLENLRISLSDTNKVDITKIRLMGGPTNDDVLLAWSNVSDNVYRAEYPRLFPNTDKQGMYKLEVTAKDSYGNETVYAESFVYYPANWLQVGRSKTLPSDIALLNRKDVPVATIKSNVLRTDSGAIAAGLQEVYFTLRSDSPYAVKFVGQTITPGETKVVNLDLGDSGKIDTFVMPASKAEGEANFMMDIPQLRSKYN